MTDLFCKLPLDILPRTDISAGTKIIYGLLVFHQGENADCWPSVRTLSAESGLSVPTVIHSIRFLEVAGLLTVERNGTGKTSHYQIKSAKETLPLKKLTRERNLSQTAKETYAGALKKLTCNRPLNRKRKDNVSPSGKIPHTGQLVTPASQTTPATDEKEPAVEKPARKKPSKDKKIPEGFERFWQAYPRRVAKTGALKAWQKLKPDFELVGKILAAVEIQKQSEQWQKDGGKFIPYPASWLNGRRWEDEIEADSDSIENGDWTADEEYLKRVDFALAKMRARA